MNATHSVNLLKIKGEAYWLFAYQKNMAVLKQLTLEVLAVDHGSKAWWTVILLMFFLLIISKQHRFSIHSGVLCVVTQYDSSMFFTQHHCSCIDYHSKLCFAKFLMSFHSDHANKNNGSQQKVLIWVEMWTSLCWRDGQGKWGNAEFNGGFQTPFQQQKGA